MARSELDTLMAMPIETMIARVAQLPRDLAIGGLLDFTALRLDFTADYLSTLATEQLRHVLLAAMLQARRRAEARTLPAAG